MHKKDDLDRIIRVLEQQIPLCGHGEDDCIDVNMTADDCEKIVGWLKRLQKNGYVKLLPCKCGCNRRQHWIGLREYTLRCKNCWFEVSGKNDADVRRRWNDAVSK